MKTEGTLRGFPRVFWIANVMELFERAAYYGLNSVLAIYLSDPVRSGGLGFSEESVGFLQSHRLRLDVRRSDPRRGAGRELGYRRMLLVAFSLLAIGYFVTGSFSTYGMVFASLVSWPSEPVCSSRSSRVRSPAPQRKKLRFRIRHLLLDDQPGRFPGAARRDAVRGFSWPYVFIASSLYAPDAPARDLPLPRPGSSKRGNSPAQTSRTR